MPQEGATVLSQKEFSDDATIRRDWNTNAKYYVTDDLYQQHPQGPPFPPTVERGRSVPCGYEYRVPTEDSAYYDDGTGTSAPSSEMYRHHVYESPQCT